MKTTKIYKYSQKSFIGYFLFFEFCILLGLVLPFFSLSSEASHYRLGFLIAFPIASFIVYSVLKVSIRSQNVLSVKLEGESLVYRNTGGRYEMRFERIKNIIIESIKKTLFQHGHRIITLDDGSNKISFANYITNQPIKLGFLRGFKRPDTTRGDELFDLILNKAKQAKIQKIGTAFSPKQLELVSRMEKKHPKLLRGVLYFFFVVMLLNGLGSIAVILDRGPKIVHLIDLIVWFGLAAFLLTIIRKISKK